LIGCGVAAAKYFAAFRAERVCWVAFSRAGSFESGAPCAAFKTEKAATALVERRLQLSVCVGLYAANEPKECRTLKVGVGPPQFNAAYSIKGS
jgi:hypothetical protein